MTEQIMWRPVDVSRDTCLDSFHKPQKRSNVYKLEK